MRDALLATTATKVYVCNVATQPGETEGFDLNAHVEALVAHTAPGIVDIVLANDRFDAKVPSDWASQSVRLHWPPPTLVPAPGLVLDEVVDPNNAHHHDPARLAAALMRIHEAEVGARRRTVGRTA